MHLSCWFHQRAGRKSGFSGGGAHTSDQEVYHTSLAVPPTCRSPRSPVCPNDRTLTMRHDHNSKISLPPAKPKKMACLILCPRLLPSTSGQPSLDMSSLGFSPINTGGWHVSCLHRRRTNETTKNAICLSHSFSSSVSPSRQECSRRPRRRLGPGR